MELNVLELKEKLDSNKITLIDVREDYEVKDMLYKKFQTYIDEPNTKQFRSIR